MYGGITGSTLCNCYDFITQGAIFQGFLLVVYASLLFPVFNLLKSLLLKF